MRLIKLLVCQISYSNKRNGMHMNYYRKIFVTYLRTKWIEQEVIDLLQGRIESIFKILL